MTLRFTDCQSFVCDPVIEEMMGKSKSCDTRTKVERRNIELIEIINQRPNSTWKAGRTSLSSVSFSTVFSYMQGELPVSKEDRRNTKNRGEFQEFLDGLHGKFSGSPRAEEAEVYSTDAKDQGMCSSCSAMAVTAAMETCVNKVNLDYYFLWKLNALIRGESLFVVHPC